VLLKPKICVYSTFYGVPAFSKKSISNHLAYCNKHCYDYKPFLYDKPTHRQFSWEKIYLGLRLLKTNHWDAIFWMDGDSWFLDIDFPLHVWLDDHQPIQFTGDENDIFNGGHFFLKNQSSALEWLEHCWQFCYINDPKISTTHKDLVHLYDQPGIIISLGGGNPNKLSSWAPAFNRLNGFPGNPYRIHTNFQEVYAPLTLSKCDAAMSLICNKWRNKCLIRPQSAMNSYPWNLEGNDFIIHFVGGTHHLMSEWSDRFEFYI